MLAKVNISASAAASASGFIDFLKLGPGTADFTTMSNASSLRARVLVKNGCLGYTQNWGKTMFIGSFQVESFDDGSIRFGSSYGNRVLNNSGSLVVNGNGNDVYFCRYANGDAQFFVVNAGAEWVNVRNVYAVESHPVELRADNLMPYGPGAGGVVLGVGNYARLRIGSTVQHLNYFSSSIGIDIESIRATPGLR